MQRTQEQIDQIKMWISNKMVSEGITSNKLKKESIKIYNKTLVQMANYFSAQEFLPLVVVRKYIMMEFMTSETSAKRYIDRIIYNNVFNYNIEQKIFYLHDDLLKKLSVA